METSELLKHSQAFNELPDDVLNEVFKIAELVTYKKGDVIYDAGSVADAVYFIIYGRVARSMGSPVVPITQIKEFRAGETFGWPSLFQDLTYGLPKRLGTITCLDDTNLMKINSHELGVLFQKAIPTHTLMVERFENTLVKELMVPGGVVTFVKRGEKMVPSFIPSSNVDRLLSNPALQGERRVKLRRYDDGIWNRAAR